MKVKPKARKKNAEALDALVPEECPKGPSFPFDINRVLALGSRCGLPTDQAARDQLAGQHGVLHSLDVLQQAVTDRALPSASDRTAEVEWSAPVHAGCPSISHTYGDNRCMDSDCAQEQHVSVGVGRTQEAPLSELSLRDRLHKVRCLLQQAGLSPAEAILGLANSDAADPANASTCVRRLSPDSTHNSSHGHIGGEEDITYDPDRAAAGAHIGSASSPVPNLARGVTYEELISLISPTPGPVAQASDAAAGAGTPPQAPIFAPELSPPELDPPSPSDHTPTYATSPLPLFSHSLFQQQQQQQQNDCFVESAGSPVSPRKVGQSSLDSSRQELELQSGASDSHQDQPADSLTIAEQHCDEPPLIHCVQLSASCQQSPGSSADEVSQHGKKRSRSATVNLPLLHPSLEDCSNMLGNQADK